MSEIRRWPQCAECSNRQGGLWVPVEEYGVEEKPALSPLYRGRVEVTAACSHAKATDAGSFRRLAQRDHVVIDVPIWWGTAHVDAAIAALKFFAPGERHPDHGLVTRIH